MEDCIGVVHNVYSSCGQVQVKRPGYDDYLSDPDQNAHWVHVDQGNQLPNRNGAGAHHGLQKGSRVHLKSYGPHAYVATGTVPRIGEQQGGGNGTDDSATYMDGVNREKCDWPITPQNANSPNGQRCKIKPPDGRYSKYAGGQNYDFNANYSPGNGPYNPPYKA